MKHLIGSMTDLCVLTAHADAAEAEPVSQSRGTSLPAPAPCYALQFVGEDSVYHTPGDEKVRLYIGDAFDLVGERKQMNVLRLSDSTRRISYQIIPRNHKNSAITSCDVDHAGGFWKVVSSNLPYVKKDSHTFEFPVDMPADGRTMVEYTVEMRYYQEGTWGWLNRTV